MHLYFLKSLMHVAREVITEFWHHFYQSLSVGAATKVPVIRHDYRKQEWKAVARILLYGYCKEGIYPVTLPSASITCTILGEECISRDVLLKAFRHMFPTMREKRLTRAWEIGQRLLIMMICWMR